MPEFITTLITTVIGSIVTIVSVILTYKTDMAKIEAKNKEAQKEAEEKAKKTEEEKKEELALLKKGIQALLRHEMLTESEKWTKKGYAPVDVKRTFEAMWVCYHSLGQNGVFDSVHEKFNLLPDSPKKGV